VVSIKKEMKYLRFNKAVKISEEKQKDKDSLGPKTIMMMMVGLKN
jgi:hypothetical protein